MVSLNLRLAVQERLFRRASYFLIHEGQERVRDKKNRKRKLRERPEERGKTGLRIKNETQRAGKNFGPVCDDPYILSLAVLVLSGDGNHREW